LNDYEEREQYKNAVSSRLDALPMPSGDTVFQTQGTENVTAYKASIPVSIFQFKKILHELGFDSENFSRVLDFGCGTGRLLCGWQLDNPHRELYGVDYNGQLIDWASSNLPSNIHFSKNELYPPLDFASSFFGCIYLISVFTHLTLRNQFLWLEEFRRILKKGQPVIISLHGPDLLNPYRIHRPNVYRDIITKRYWDNSLEDREEGKNPFVSFHMPDFAVNTLFSGWKVLGYYKGGRVRNQLLAAGKQDMYVLTH
jgi:SAM-dependent methyltransferase